MRTTYPPYHAWFYGLALILSGCGDSGGGALPDGEGPCERPSDCQGSVCIAVVDAGHPPVYCTQTCAGGCPDGFYCDSSTFGLVGLDFCRLGEPPPQGEPPPNEEPPRRPCAEDGDCDSGEVCATWMGERDCTIACAEEPDCTPPPLGGVTFDVATCAADETPGQTRDVCVPDEDCYPNVQTCITGLPF